MMTSNGTSALPPTDQFAKLVELIETEERRTAHELTDARQHDVDIEMHHRLGVAAHNTLASHTRMRELHSAMLKVHRKIRQRHHVAVHQCRILLERFQSGRYTEGEIADAVARVQDLHQRIRRENALIEEERQKIMAEHRAFVASLGQITD